MIVPKKRLGQHFLRDSGIAAQICRALENRHSLPTLEIGPGEGVLTDMLLAQTAPLTLVEVDEQAVAHLLNRFGSNLNIVHADFLKLNLRSLFDTQFNIIGNFPYNISSQILFKVLKHKDLVPEIVCMLQKEVAERIASPHGSKVYGILSVLMQLYYEVKYLFTVEATAFVPPPKVRSGVLHLQRRCVAIEGVDEALLFSVVKTAFNCRRKIMRNSLRPLLTDDVDLSHPYFTMRPEQLPPHEFVTLTNLLDPQRQQQHNNQQNSSSDN